MTQLKHINVTRGVAMNAVTSQKMSFELLEKMMQAMNSKSQTAALLLI
jgi:hypothetical protein